MATKIAHSDQLSALERPGRTVKEFVGPDDANHLAMGLVEFPPGSDAPAHTHDAQEEIVFVLSGVGSVLLDGQPFSLHPGTFVFIPPGVQHQVRNEGNTPVRLLYAFSPPVVVGTWE